jgi:hypothetical protein
MLMTTNIHTFYAEATQVASVLPFRRSFDPKLRAGHALALAGRYVR